MWLTDAVRNAMIDAETGLIGSAGLVKIYDGAKAVTAAASGSVFTSTAHGYANGDVVTLVGLDAAGLTALNASGVTADYRYYVVSSTTNTFQLSLTSGGSAITVAADLAASKATVCKVPGTIGAAAVGTLLATVTLGAWGAASAGSSSGADPASVTPAANGTAGYVHVCKADGTVLLVGSVSATGGGGYCTLSSTALSTAVPVDISTPSLSIAAY